MASNYIQAKLDDDLWQWVDDTLQHGQKQAFIVSCFENLRTLMTEGTLPPPSEFARLSTAATVLDWASPSERKENRDG
jgi:hypothetical protein